MQPARVLARGLAKDGHHLIYGGSRYGLMGLMAREMQAGGAHVTGVTIPVYSASISPELDECIVAQTVAERKTSMLERADAVVTLVGGIGTLDELTELIELKRQQRHDMPILVLNTDGFYDGFRLQLEHIAAEGMLRAGENTHLPVRTLDEFVRFVATPTDVRDGISAQAVLPAAITI